MIGLLKFQIFLTIVFIVCREILTNINPYNVKVKKIPCPRVKNYIIQVMLVHTVFLLISVALFLSIVVCMCVDCDRACVLALFAGAVCVVCGR